MSPKRVRKTIKYWRKDLWRGDNPHRQKLRAKNEDVALTILSDNSLLIVGGELISYYAELEDAQYNENEYNEYDAWNYEEDLP